jgi:hypothetical protein
MRRRTAGRPRSRRIRALVWLTVALLGLLVTSCTTRVGGSPVAASGSYSGDPLASLANQKDVGLRKKFNASPKSVNDYWSSSAIKNAKPRSNAPGQTNSGAPTDGATGIAIPPSDGPIGEVAADSNGTSAAGAPWTKAGLSGSTNGRLYFVSNNEPYVCSATVVNSSSGDIVATAGHCVWDTETGTGFAKDFLFIPADADNGTVAPFGRWTALSVDLSPQFSATARETSQGSTGDGWAFDIAFLKMAPLNGKSIQSVTGGQGIAFGIPVEGITAIGYPSAPPFDGTVERYCSSATWQPGDFGDYEINCNMTPGCSGGSWLTRFDPTRGAGYLVSVTSVGGGGVLNGAQLGQAAYTLYQHAIAGT